MAALSRQGFKFSEEQKQLIKWLEETGRTAEAQDIILSALEESYDGAAKAARDTFGGALTAVKHNLSNLLVGDNGSLDKAKEALEEFNKVLTDPKTKQQFAEIAQSVINGLTTVVENIDVAVKAFQFLAKVVEGVVKVFKIAANGLIASLSTIKAGIDELQEASITDLLTPVGIVNKFARGTIKELKDANSVARQALRGMHNEAMDYGIPKELITLPAANQDLPKAGDKAVGKSKTGKTDEELQAEFKLAQAEKARQDAAKKAAEEAQKAFAKQQEAINKELTALERAAKTWGMNADEVKLYDLELQGANKSQIEQAKHQLAIVANLEKEQETRENYLSLVKRLQTEEERRKEELAQQLAIIKEMESLTGESDKETFKRAAMGSFDDSMPADKYSDDSNPFEAMDKAAEAQKEWYAQQLELLNEYRQQRQDLSEEWDAKEEELTRKHQEGLAAIQKAKWDEGLKGMSEAE